MADYEQDREAKDIFDNNETNGALFVARFLALQMLVENFTHQELMERTLTGGGFKKGQAKAQAELTLDKSKWSSIFSKLYFLFRNCSFNYYVWWFLEYALDKYPVQGGFKQLQKKGF